MPENRTLSAAAPPPPSGRTTPQVVSPVTRPKQRTSMPDASEEVLSTKEESHGSGSWFTEDDGWEYHGEFMDRNGARLRHGFGVEKNPSGSIYSGNWKLDMRYGRGVWTVPNPKPKGGGDWRYEGDFSQDSVHGMGVQTWPDGSIYAGEWRQGKMHGHGCWSEQEGGMTYSGEFRNDVRHGFGIARAKDESIKQAQEGEWRNDEFVCSDSSRAVIASAIAKNASREAMEASAQARRECQKDHDAASDDSSDSDDSYGSDDAQARRQRDSDGLLLGFNASSTSAYSPALPDWISELNDGAAAAPGAQETRGKGRKGAAFNPRATASTSRGACCCGLLSEKDLF